MVTARIVTEPAVELEIFLLFFKNVLQSVSDIGNVSEIFSPMGLVCQRIDSFYVWSPGHAFNTACYATSIATRYLSFDYGARIYWATLLHDIGKAGIPHKILTKEGPLSPSERNTVQRHTTIGSDLIKYFLEVYRQFKNGTNGKTDPEVTLEIAKKIALYHHENYDGSGYPYGLKHQEIPVEARIVRIADMYDALTSDRVYRRRISQKEALNLIEEGKGRLFDPEIAETALQVFSRKEILF